MELIDVALEMWTPIDASKNVLYAHTHTHMVCCLIPSTQHTTKTVVHMATNRPKKETQGNQR